MVGAQRVLLEGHDYITLYISACISEMGTTFSIKLFLQILKSLQSQKSLLLYVNVIGDFIDLNKKRDIHSTISNHSNND